MSGKLCLYNSLSKSVEEFIPRGGGRKVNWYSCGPTVYDASHMGHARSYISFDIIRRVVENYFGYDVFFVMNITDVDDKIIKRARQEYLFKEYCSSAPTVPSIIKDLNVALDSYVSSTLSETDPDKKKMREAGVARMTKVMQEVAASSSSDEGARQQLLQGTKDMLYEFLDKGDLGTFGNEIFGDFARKWEEEYFKDMEALNVLGPHVLTRVSEYVPEIVEFILKIIENGYGYESNGSVYFDVGKYKSSPNHKYAKLVPEAVGDEKILLEGEGELIGNRRDKKSLADFALWKASRAGEPSWDSPWGKGRPGWHIECSAMASAIVGAELDIHTGGVDLKFPHHDNEIAQSEAYFDSNDWVRYFLHSGHLTIAGCKMSKSLKNFITIKDALKEFTASQLRLTFLLHSWKDTLDYSPSGMQTAVQMEQKIQEFFLNVKDVSRNYPDPYPKWGKAELALNDNFYSAKKAVHAALCDNIDTRSAMFALRELIGAGNIYIQQGRSAKLVLNGPLLNSIANYILDMLRIFGVVERSKDEQSRRVVAVEDTVLPFLKVLSDFREMVRGAVKTVGVDPEVKGKILGACDEIRDEKLPSLGVRMEDHEGSSTVIKYIGREAMKKEKEQREKMEREKAAEKAKKKEEQDRVAAGKEALRRIPPSQLFLKDDKYSLFNEDGIPTHDKDGKPITKSQLKKLEKVYAQQKKVYEEYLSKEQ